MRVWVLVLAMAAAAMAQRDAFTGIFQGDKVTLELKGAAGTYSGTLTVQGQSFPISATAEGGSARGTFEAAGARYPFTLAPYGNGMKLTSQGMDFLLIRKIETAPPPPPPQEVLAPRPAAEETPAPAGAVTASGAPRLTAPRRPIGTPAPAPAAADQIPAPAGAVAPNAPAQSAPPASPSIVGYWRNATGYAKFNPDGTGTVDGQNGRYEIHGDQLTMIGAQGQLTVTYAVRGDQLTLSTAAGSIALNRAKEETGAGSIHMELVGKWCWVSQVYANNGGARQSNRCITLEGNGRYTYFGLTDSYNPYGGATSQSGDQGTWTATDTTLTTRSASGRVTTYQLEKRNHPKNVRDPMIVLNGEPFVTFYNKPPW